MGRAEAVRVSGPFSDKVHCSKIARYSRANSRQRATEADRRLSIFSAVHNRRPWAAPYRGPNLEAFLGSARCTGKYQMIYAGLGITAVALTATAAVASAQAQTQTETPGRTVWDHNGSVMYLVANGPSREFYYQKPRPGMLDAGARPGSLLFRGQVHGGQYSGTAYFFNPHCGSIPFEVKGPILEDEERIALTGQAPRVGQNCRTYGSYTSNLEFRRSKSDEANQIQEAKTATLAPALVASRTEIKADVASTNRGEVSAAPTEQRATRNEAPSTSASLVDSQGPGAPAAMTSVPNETPGAKDLDKYLWGTAFLIMIVWLLIKLFGNVLIRMK
jgi:hypothetical protein